MEAHVSELRLNYMITSSMMKEKQYRKRMESAEVVEDLEEVLLPVLVVRQRYCRHRDAVVVHRDGHIHRDEVRQQRLPRIGQSSYLKRPESKFPHSASFGARKKSFPGFQHCCDLKRSYSLVYRRICTY